MRHWQWCGWRVKNHGGESWKTVFEKKKKREKRKQCVINVDTCDVSLCSHADKQAGITLKPVLSSDKSAEMRWGPLTLKLKAYFLQKADADVFMKLSWCCWKYVSDNSNTLKNGT